MVQLLPGGGADTTDGSCPQELTAWRGRWTRAGGQVHVREEHVLQGTESGSWGRAGSPGGLQGSTGHRCRDQKDRGGQPCTLGAVSWAQRCSQPCTLRAVSRDGRDVRALEEEETLARGQVRREPGWRERAGEESRWEEGRADPGLESWRLRGWDAPPLQGEPAPEPPSVPAPPTPSTCSLAQNFPSLPPL